MKHIFHLTFALLAGMALCACSSDDPMDNDQTPVPVQPGEAGSDDSWGVKIEGDMTRGLSLSGTTLTPNFNGETIYVYYGGTNVGTLKAPSGNLTGDRTPTGRLNNATYTQGQSLTLCFLKPKGFSDYTGQKGTLDDIAANFDYATATATITNVDNNTHTLTISKATFTSQQAIIGFKFSIGLNSGDVITIKQNNASGTTKATVTSPAVTANSTVVYVALPLTASDAQYTYYFDIKRGSNAYCKGTLALGSDKKMKNGKYYSTQTVTLYKHMTHAASSDKGKVIGTDGYIYPYGTSGITSTGPIVYVGTGTDNSTYQHGIVLSLNNPSSKVIWDNRNNTATSPSAPSSTSGWIIPSAAQWNTIVKSLKNTTTNLSYTENTTFANVPVGSGAANLSLNNYWSTTAGGDGKKNYRADKGCYANQGTGTESKYANYVRRIYVF